MDIKNKLIHIKDINENLYLADGLIYDYITTSGNVHLYCGDGMFYKRSLYQNKHNKYIYSVSLNYAKLYLAI